MKIRRIFLTLSALALCLGAQAQTNDVVAQTLEEQVSAAQQELDQIKRKADETIQDAERELSILQSQEKEIKEQYNQQCEAVAECQKGCNQCQEESL